MTDFRIMTDVRIGGHGSAAAPRDLSRIVLGLTLALVVAGCGSDTEDGPSGTPEAVRVGVRTVDSESVHLERSWAGRVEPLRTVSIQAPREGRIAEVAVRDGDAVQAGQVLLRMVGTDVAARREVALERSEALELELERWERLATQGAAGPGEVTEARLRTLEAREALAELDAFSENYVIRAPAAGRTHGLSVGVGTQVAGGQILLQVDDDSTWGIRLSVPAWETVHFEDPSGISVRDDGGVSVTVDRVAFASAPSPGFVRVDLFLGDAPTSRSGAEVVHQSAEDLLLLPWTAVAGDDDRYWVARVVPGDPDRIERRTVELGRPHERGVEVLSGLEAGDRVVLYEPRAHPEGRLVIPVEAAP